MNNKKITFLLPGPIGEPVGGVKVVLEYANKLALDGYEVHLALPGTLYFVNKVHLFKRIDDCIRFIARKILKKYTPKQWFNIDLKVKQDWILSLNEKNIPSSDILIATSVETSYYLNNYKNYRPDQKYYLIQGYEEWSYGKEVVNHSYHFAMTKIAISNFLVNKVGEVGEQAILVENGLDFNYFQKKNNIEQRDKFRVAMLYHTSPLKGCEDGIEALKIVRAKYPQLNATLFGVFPKPENLPWWISYYQKPTKQTHNEIYNNASIFLGTSLSEGFGLTVCEAMQCGCAIVCTDITGYAVVKSGENALTSPIKNPEGLAKNMIRLIEDDSLRFRIAEIGHHNIQKYTWERASEKIKEILQLK